MTDKVKMQAIRYTMNIAKANAALNEAIPSIYDMLQELGLTPIVLKGQGVAQNYIDPTLRQAGDIDVFFCNYSDVLKAYQLFQEKMIPIKALTKDTIEATFDFQGCIVELHGYINDSINAKMKERFKCWMKQIVESEPARRIPIDKGSLLSFPLRLDVVFLFVHLIRHYLGGGIGLRQIADWMRMLYTYREEIDKDLLIRDINFLGLRKIWAVFACMAVEYLGCPKEHMPLYEAKYHQEARRVLRYVLDSGNFGYHDARTKSKSKSYYLRRAKAFQGNMYKILRNFTMFPQETLYRLPGYFKSGLERTKFK